MLLFTEWSRHLLPNTLPGDNHPASTTRPNPLSLQPVIPLLGILLSLPSLTLQQRHGIRVTDVVHPTQYLRVRPLTGPATSATRKGTLRECADNACGLQILQTPDIQIPEVSIMWGMCLPILMLPRLKLQNQMMRMPKSTTSSISQDWTSIGSRT